MSSKVAVGLFSCDSNSAFTSNISNIKTVIEISLY